MSNGDDKLVYRQMLSAAIAGTVADAMTYPMLTVKSRLMVQGATRLYKGTVDAFFKIASQEGWTTLYKGFSTITVVASSQAIYMAIYQTSKRVVPGGQDNPAVQFGGGIVATLVQSLINVPLDVVRQRQMVQKPGQYIYKGSLDTVRKLYRQEGMGSLYKGFFFAQTVWGPYNAIYLPLWEGSKKLCARQCGVESVEKLDLKYELGSSFLSASVAAALTNPMDVIKTRIQVQGKSKTANSTNYAGPMDAAAAIWKTEGWRGLTSGMISRICWVAPSGMIMFTLYDQILKRL